MLKYFDILYVRIYWQYIKWKEADIPKLTSILVLSFFQSMNVLAVYFFIRSLFEREPWFFSKLQIIIIMVVVVLMDYVRIFKVIGFERLLKRYEDPSKRKVVLHPIIYFVVSIAMLFFLKLLNLFPQIR